MYKTVKCIFIILFLLPTYLIADEGELEKEPSPLITFGLYEGLILVNSALASSSPEGYGAMLVILSPLALTGKESSQTAIVAVGGVAAIGAYNLTEMKKTKYSKKDIFIANFLMWHVWAGAGYITESITGKKVKVNSLSVHPTKDGAFFSYSYEF